MAMAGRDPPYAFLQALLRREPVIPAARWAISRLLCRNNAISDGVSILGAGEVPSF